MNAINFCRLSQAALLAAVLLSGCGAGGGSRLNAGPGAPGGDLADGACIAGGWEVTSQLIMVSSGSYWPNGLATGTLELRAFEPDVAVPEHALAFEVTSPEFEVEARGLVLNTIPNANGQAVGAQLCGVYYDAVDDVSVVLQAAGPAINCSSILLEVAFVTYAGDVVVADGDDTDLTSSAIVEGAPVLSSGGLVMRLRR